MPQPTPDGPAGGPIAPPPLRTVSPHYQGRRDPIAMRKQELSAFSMIVAAFVLGSVATVSLSGCKPPTAVPRADATSNTTASNTTVSVEAAATAASSNVTAASE